MRDGHRPKAIRNRVELGRQRSLIAISLLPLALGVVWGLYFEGQAYVTFRCVQQLAHDTALSDFPSHCFSLITGFLALAAWFGLPIAPTALVLSALGWGVVTIVVFQLLHRVIRCRPVVAFLTALLIALCPIVYSSLGTGVSWTVAWAVLAMFAGVRERWSFQTGALVIMLLVRFDLGTLVLVFLLLGARWRAQRRFPQRPFIILSIVASGCAGIMFFRFSQPFFMSNLDPAAWRVYFDRLVYESELYWLFLPLVALGLLTVSRFRTLSWGWFCWGTVTLLGDDLTGWAILGVAGLLWTGAGIDRLLVWLQRRDWTRLEPQIVNFGGALILGLPLLIAETSSLWQRYQMRPRAYRGLETTAAAWLHAHSEPDQMLLGSARAGFLAERPVQPWHGGRGDEKDVPELVSSLIQSPPDFVVSARTIAWDQLTRVPWFQERYQPIHSFSSAYSTVSPLIVWERRSTPCDKGERQSIYVETPVGANLVAYQVWPWDIEGGESIYVTLYWEATRPITQAFNTVLRAISPLDGHAWAQQDLITPRSVPASWWQAGQVIAERFELSTDPAIPVGAYQVNFSLRNPRSLELLTVYRGHDPNTLDRVLLGYAAVPWTESLAPGAAAPAGATFGDQVRLESVGLAGELAPGGELAVTLYWEALRPPLADYAVFLHLIDEHDTMLASHDGRPMMGRYTTLAWRPGHVVPDEHPIALPADLTAVAYRLRVGLYLPETGDRLPAFDRQGQELPGEYVILPIE